MVAGGEPPDLGADRLDHTGALVATDDRQRHGHVAGAGVVVGVAHPGGAHAHEHVGGSGVVELDVLDAPVLPDPPEHRGACGRRHGLPLLSVGRPPAGIDPRPARLPPGPSTALPGGDDRPPTATAGCARDAPGRDRFRPRSALRRRARPGSGKVDG